MGTWEYGVSETWVSNRRWEIENSTGKHWVNSSYMTGGGDLMTTCLGVPLGLPLTGEFAIKHIGKSNGTCNRKLKEVLTQITVKHHKTAKKSDLTTKHEIYM